MLTATGGLPAYKKLAAFNDIVLAKSNETCMDYSYDNMISDLRNITWSSNGGTNTEYTENAFQKSDFRVYCKLAWVGTTGKFMPRNSPIQTSPSCL